MERRKFIALVGAAAAWPAAVWGQQAAIPVVGFLNSASSETAARRISAFREGLRDAGFLEGRDVTIEYRFAHGQYDRLTALAADLANRNVKVIAATGALPSPLAAKAATTSIPIVFTTGADPVAVGLVTNLNRPGGNVTGVSTFNVELASKRLEIMRQLLPDAVRVALLVNPGTPATPTIVRDMRQAARSLGMELHILYTGAEREFEPAIVAARKSQAAGLVIGTDALFNNSAERLAAITLGHKIPTVFQFREFAAAGGLASYGSSLTDDYRQVGTYVARILKGEKAAEMAVQRSTKVELMINLTTAKALGLDVPPSLLTRADELIE
jgi:ABC-type uncharacterized transport system substrate-binding protein